LLLVDETWDVLLVLLIPCKTLRLTRVGARPGHPISGLMQCIEEIGTDALVGHEAAWRRAG
jgi:hypothetical protein